MENLEHNFVFNKDIQESLVKIQGEYAASDRVAFKDLAMVVKYFYMVLLVVGKH